jgi:YVTN family beta-propeller protein
MRRFLVVQVAALVATLGACAALSAPALAHGSAPSGLALSPDGSTLYATQYLDNTVELIDTTTFQTTSTIAVGDEPSALALSQDGTTLYVANYGDGTVSVVNTATDLVTHTIGVGNLPDALVLAPDGSALYVANYLDGTVSVIDTATDTVTNTLNAGDGLNALAISPDGSTLYASNADGEILAMDSTTGNVTQTFNSQDSSEAIALSPGGDTLYASDLDEAVIYGFNVAQGGGFYAEEPSSDQPTALTLGADGQVLFVGGNTTGSIEMLDTTTHQWTGAVSGLTEPTSMLVDAATGTLYACDGLDDGPTATSVSWDSTPTITLPASESAPVAGQTLTADTDGWLPSVDDLSYEWFADGQQVAGATSSTLELDSAEVGDTISVQVTGPAGSETSAATAAVIQAPQTTPPPEQTAPPTTTTPAPATSAPTSTPTPKPTRRPTPRRKPRRREQQVTVKLVGVARGATYFGAAPVPRCVAHASYGSVRCRIRWASVTSAAGTRITFTAHATGNAGAAATASVSADTTAVRLTGLRESHGVFVVKLGDTYTFEVASRTEPLYVDAAVAPRAPYGTHAWFKRAGTLHGMPLWKLPVYLPAGLADFRLWRIGIAIGTKLRVITIQT